VKPRLHVAQKVQGSDTTMLSGVIPFAKKLKQKEEPSGDMAKFRIYNN
jgi:hypothetical protein